MKNKKNKKKKEKKNAIISMKNERERSYGRHSQIHTHLWVLLSILLTLLSDTDTHMFIYHTSFMKSLAYT